MKHQILNYFTVIRKPSTLTTECSRPSNISSDYLNLKTTLKYVLVRNKQSEVKKLQEARTAVTMKVNPYGIYNSVFI